MDSVSTIFYIWFNWIVYEKWLDYAFPFFWRKKDCFSRTSTWTVNTTEKKTVSIRPFIHVLRFLQWRYTSLAKILRKAPLKTFKIFPKHLFSFSKGNGQLSHPFSYRSWCSNAMKLRTCVVLNAIESTMTFDCSRRIVFGSKKGPVERKNALFCV
jgi:hypothetical protein